MKKRAILFLLVACLLVCILPAYALMDVAGCKSCDTGKCFRVERDYTDWFTIAYTRCSKNPSQQDKNQRRTITDRFECNNCGIGYTETFQESRLLCEH